MALVSIVNLTKRSLFMEPIFNNKGKTVAWLKSGEENNIIYNRSAKAIAFTSDNSVFDYKGKYICRFFNGYFRERSGNAFSFVKGASGGPLLPITEISPIPPIPSIPPIKPIESIPPIPPVDSLSWSGASWQEIMEK